MEGRPVTGDDTTPSRPTRPTDPSELARLKDLFFAVSDLPDDAARRAWLQAQGVSEGLQARVMALMAEDADSTRQGPPDVTAARRAVTEALADALAPEGSATLHQAAARAMVGQRLGPWRLLSPLGAGGMGHVFLAERADGLYQREVAIKLLRGRAHPTALALLARERQILATLAHPHIARLLDGGTTPDGQPYLVMERVHGQRIDHWCETRQAPLALRLALFDQVCDAVGEAHRRLVVHCDLKPANVLVTDEAQAMLLDFGVARLQQDGNGGPGPADDDDTPDIIGLTLNYASPEQRAGEAPTPASDIYSLGRLLQTLLKGLPPTQALRGLRQRELQALLDRAMAEQPAQRYRDVGELQADLSRWHRHEPLQAMPARWTYRGGKLLRRQWPWALAGGTAVLLVAGFTWQLAQQRDRALQAEAMARHE
ncbi:MAG: serine/threonine-protein kinase, partial [Rubrivivax sp.]